MQLFRLMNLYSGISHKYHTGRAPHSEQWVYFGLVDTCQSPAIGFMEAVPCRDGRTVTLLPIIQPQIKPTWNQWTAFWSVRLFHCQAQPGCFLIVDHTIGVQRVLGLERSGDSNL